MIHHSYDWNDSRTSVSTLVNALFFVLTLLPIIFSLMGIMVSIGLLQLPEVRTRTRVIALEQQQPSLEKLEFA